jgi:hypothetical protein
MSCSRLPTAFANRIWTCIQAFCFLLLAACSTAPEEVLIYQAYAGPTGAAIVLSATDPSVAEFAGTTLDIPPGAFPEPVSVEFYRVPSWEAPGARAAGAALRIVAKRAVDDEPAPQGFVQEGTPLPAEAILHLSIPLPDEPPQSGDRNLMAVEWESGERFYTGGWTVTPNEAGGRAQLRIESPKLGVFFPVIYTAGPLMPEPLITPVDLLFVVDNSRSMGKFQRLLFSHDGMSSPRQNSLPWRLLNSTSSSKCFPNKEQLWNTHMAVVSSDLGVMPKMLAGTDWPSPLPAPFANGSCGPGPTGKNTDGDQGTLQTASCTARSITDLNVCPAFCKDDRIFPALEKNLQYVRKWTEYDTAAKALRDYPVFNDKYQSEDAIHCRSVLGEKGCGVEMPLASAVRAIGNQTATPTGYLRDPATSLLVVVVVTNEDDCSIDPSRRKDAYPTSSKYPLNASGLRENCNMISSPECFNMEYRCFALDNECAGIVDTDGAKMNCKIKSPNLSPYLTPVESLVQQMAQYKDPLGATQYRKMGFVLLAPNSDNFEVEYINDSSGMSAKKTPWLNLKQRKISPAEYLVTPQLRYTKLERLKNDAMNPFSDINLNTAVKFVLLQDIEKLIKMDGSLDSSALITLAISFQTKIAPYVSLTKKGKDSGFTEPPCL